MKRSRVVWPVVGVAAFIMTLTMVLVLLQPTIAPRSWAPIPGPMATSASGETGEPIETTPPPGYRAVDEDVAAAIAEDGTAPVTLVVDDEARVSADFQDLATALDARGGGVYSGQLDQQSLLLASGITGIKVSLDRVVTLEDPIVDDSSSYTILTDTSTTVGEVDPRLAGVRTQLNALGTGRVIAVIDTGVDPLAIGMAGKVVLRQDFSSSTSECSDNGFLDPVGHGTHVASIAAGGADSRDTGIVGVAPGAKIIDLRVFNCASKANGSNVDAALQWVLDNRVARNITVVNLSLGYTGGPVTGTDTTSILVNRLVASGVFVSVAAGNKGDEPSTVNAPATARYATSVGSAGVTQYGSFLAPYSSHGPVATGLGVDLVAAGTSIRAAYTTASWRSTATLSGTSMAAPYIAGLAALLHQRNAALAPSGSICTLSAGCAEGVAIGSVANPLEDAMVTDDWFQPGPDAASGRGLVDASGSLLNEAGTSAPFLRVSLDSTSPNIIRVPAHSEPLSLSLLLDTSIRGSSGGTFEYTWLDEAGETSEAQFPCNISEASYGSSCSWSPAGWTQRNYYFFAPPSTTAMFLRITTDTPKGATVMAPGLPGSLTFGNGVVVDDTAIDPTTGAAVITVRRTKAGAAAELGVAMTPGLVSGATSVLLGGSAGATATIDVALDPEAPMTAVSGRVTFTADGMVIGTGSIGNDPARATGPGRVTVGGKQLTSGELFSSGGGITSNGTVFGSSSHPDLARAPASGGWTMPGPFVVLPGSNAAIKVPITQSTLSAINTTGASGDGTKLVLQQFPAGSGLVPGDGDSRYVWAIHDRTTQLSTEIGSSTIRPELGTYGWPVISETGGEVAFVARDGTDWVLYWQGGSAFSELREIARFAESDVVNWRVSGVSAGVVVTERWIGGTQVDVYPSTGGAPVTLGVGWGHPSSLSSDGTSVGLVDRDNGPRCYDSSTGLTVQMGGSDEYFWGDIGTRPGCASIVGTADVPTAGIHGSEGNRLVEALADGSTQQLALGRPDSNQFSWITDPSGTAFITATGRALDPGDTNGLTDFYRGIHGTLTFTQAPVPVISGSATVGSTLAVATGSWLPAGASLRIQWKRDGLLISGANAQTYVLTPSDAETRISVTVTATRSGYEPSSKTSAPTAPIGAVGRAMSAPVPTITGSYQVWSLLTARAGTWAPTGVTLSYQWLRDGVEVPGETGAQYFVQSADAGHTIAVTITGRRAGYTTTARTSSAAVIKLDFSSSPIPTVTGDNRVGAILTASPGSWGPSPVEHRYQWYRSALPISGATSAVYTVKSADAGHGIAVEVSGVKPGYGTRSQFSVALTIDMVLVAAPVPTISGGVDVGSVLTSSTGTWSPSPVSHTRQWLRNGTPIPGATAATYTLADDDAGASITVAVTGTRPGYSSVTKISAPKVVRTPFEVTTDPTISGTPRVGAVLTAQPGPWQPSASVFSYVWTRGGIPIPGATRSTYVVTTTDAGKSVAVTVTGSRTAFTPVARGSLPVEIENLFTSVPVPVVTGSVDVGGTLTAVVGTWSPTPTTLSTQWLRNGDEIAGATSSTYTLVEADVGSAISVRTTGERPGYTSVTRTSTPQVVNQIFSASPPPSISGLPRVGATLRATVTGWVPASATFRIVWLRNGVPIPSATASTYVVTDADLGARLTVAVTVTKPGFTTVVRTSAQVAIGSAWRPPPMRPLRSTSERI